MAAARTGCRAGRLRHHRAPTCPRPDAAGRDDHCRARGPDNGSEPCPSAGHRRGHQPQSRRAAAGSDGPYAQAAPRRTRQGNCPTERSGGRHGRHSVAIGHGPGTNAPGRGHRPCAGPGAARVGQHQPRSAAAASPGPAAGGPTAATTPPGGPARPPGAATARHPTPQRPAQRTPGSRARHRTQPEHPPSARRISVRPSGGQRIRATARP